MKLTQVIDRPTRITSTFIDLMIIDNLESINDLDQTDQELIALFST